ncbi:putative phosphoribosylformylglycinamidine synthase [Medicago truncatula]|uniref:Putative phosphoribosylformylglycinamidine synthase n=1 Tax=Medicago truncatula TaxID=3880 RepID=A0A396IX71_MEDTR|nr:putative phosphoribosylformylglycinamidine synthase [Medicago truncatula]
MLANIILSRGSSLLPFVSAQSCATLSSSSCLQHKKLKTTVQPSQLSVTLSLHPSLINTKAFNYLIAYMAASGEIGLSEFLQGTCRQTLFLVKKPHKQTRQLLWGTLCNRGRVLSSTPKSLRLRCQAQQSPRVVVSGGSAASTVQEQSGLVVEKSPAQVIHFYRVPFIQESAVAEVTSLSDVKASGNWMYAAKLDGEGAAMYDAAVSLSEAMIELGIAIDGGKDSSSFRKRSCEGSRKSCNQCLCYLS